MPLSPDDRASLNEGEREILSLLSVGHTIKTAAVELGLSENAVNERLRSARRKTGAQSSRELARALYPTDPQISCDDFPVVPPGAALVDKPGRRFAIPRSWLTVKGFVIMSTIALAAATALIGFASLGGDDPSPPDAWLPPLAAPGMELRQQLESEASDPDWSLATQQELSRRFAGRDGVSMVAVRCRTSLCEVNARVPQANRRDAIRAVSDGEFLESLSDTGIERVEVIDMRFVEGEELGTITLFLARAR